MEQDWIEAIPVSLLQQWEITEEVQNWIRTNNQQTLEQDQLYKEMVRQILMLKDLLLMKVVKEHILILLRLLATQFKNERKDKDFDSNIRILQQAQAIKNIFQNRTFDLKAHLQKLMKNQDPSYSTTGPLPVTEIEMRKLEDKLLQHAELTKQLVTLQLPVKSQETC